MLLLENELPIPRSYPHMQVLPFMLNPETAAVMRGRIDDNTTHNSSYYVNFPLLFDSLSPFGTSHLCVLAENGDAVAATSTINN